MAEIVNLRQFRKRKARERKDEAASANRAKHGRTAADKAIADRQSTLEQRKLDGHRRMPSECEDSQE